MKKQATPSRRLLYLNQTEKESGFSGFDDHGQPALYALRNALTSKKS